MGLTANKERTESQAKSGRKGDEADEQITPAGNNRNKAKTDRAERRTEAPTESQSPPIATYPSPRRGEQRPAIAAAGTRVRDSQREPSSEASGTKTRPSERED